MGDDSTDGVAAGGMGDGSTVGVTAGEEVACPAVGDDVRPAGAGVAAVALPADGEGWRQPAVTTAMSHTIASRWSSGYTCGLWVR